MGEAVVSIAVLVGLICAVALLIVAILLGHAAADDGIDALVRHPRWKVMTALRNLGLVVLGFGMFGLSLWIDPRRADGTTANSRAHLAGELGGCLFAAGALILGVWWWLAARSLAAQTDVP